MKLNVLVSSLSFAGLFIMKTNAVGEEDSSERSGGLEQLQATSGTETQNPPQVDNRVQSDSSSSAVQGSLSAGSSSNKVNSVKVSQRQSSKLDGEEKESSRKTGGLAKSSEEESSGDSRNKDTKGNNKGSPDGVEKVAFTVALGILMSSFLFTAE